MAIARHLIVEGSRSSVSNGEPDHAVQRPGFRNAPAKIQLRQRLAQSNISDASDLPNIVYAPRREVRCGTSNTAMQEVWPLEALGQGGEPIFASSQHH